MIPFAELGCEIDDRNISEGIIRTRLLQKASGQVDEVLRPEQDILVDRHNRPRTVLIDGLLNVFEELFAEGSATIAVADVRDMAGDLEQDRHGHEQVAASVDDAGGFFRTSGVLDSSK